MKNREISREPRTSRVVHSAFNPEKSTIKVDGFNLSFSNFINLSIMIASQNNINNVKIQLLTLRHNYEFYK